SESTARRRARIGSRQFDGLAGDRACGGGDLARTDELRSGDVIYLVLVTRARERGGGSGSAVFAYDVTDADVAVRYGDFPVGQHLRCLLHQTVRVDRVAQHRPGRAAFFDDLLGSEMIARKTCPIALADRDERGIDDMLDAGGHSGVDGALVRFGAGTRVESNADEQHFRAASVSGGQGFGLGEIAEARRCTEFLEFSELLGRAAH